MSRCSFRPRRRRFTLTLTMCEIRALYALVSYVFDDEQEHCFSLSPEERPESIYVRAIRPLALASGFRTEPELAGEEAAFAFDDDLT